MDLVKVFMTKRADAIFLEDGFIVNVSIFYVSNYHQADLFVQRNQIEDVYILPCDISLFLVTSSRAFFCMYGFDYSSGTLSVSFHPGMGADDVTTPSSGL